MQKIKLNRQHYIFIALSLFLLVEVLILIPMGLRRVSRTSRRIKDIRRKVKVIKNNWPEKNSYLEKAGRLRDNIKNIRAKIINPGRESELISFLSQKSQLYNIKMNAITPLNSFASSGANFSYVPFKIEAEGGFHDLGRFFSFLRNSDYIFVLKELAISGSGRKPNKINMVLCGLRENKQ